VEQQTVAPEIILAGTGFELVWQGALKEGSPADVGIRRDGAVVFTDKVTPGNEEDYKRYADAAAEAVGLKSAATGMLLLLTAAGHKAASGQAASVSLGALNAADAPHPTDPDTSAGQLDSFFEIWLQKIEKGWAPSVYGSHVEQLMTALEEADGEGELTVPGFNEMLAHASKRLKECGYSTLTPQKLHRQLEQRRTLQKRTDASGQPQAQQSLRFVALSKLDGNNATNQRGILDIRNNNKLITNFEAFWEEDVAIQDDVASKRSFRGKICLTGQQPVLWSMNAGEFATNTHLQTAVFNALGPKAEISCDLDTLRRAISEISNQVTSRRATTNFGWEDDSGSAYLVPGGRITANGFEPTCASGGMTVDLGECAQAVHLGMRALSAQDLDRVRRHLIADFRELHHHLVTDTIFALVGTAVLRRFAGVSSRFAVWLKGGTGTGKTLMGKLGMSFFGDYSPNDDSRFVSWSWSPLAIEKAGYYFRDALFLVDDYKTATAQHNQVVRLLQAYGDGVGRGRLKADANFNAPRPIRGLLLVTGENAIDHEASSVARTIMVPVEAYPIKDLDRRSRCVQECCNYAGVTADFIRWLIEQRRTQDFANRVREQEQCFLKKVAGQPNDARVAANFGVLAAAYAEFAEYLSNVWPEANESVRHYIESDLTALLQNMMHEVRDQRPTDIFWATLAELARCERIRFDPTETGTGALIGKWAAPHSGRSWISTELALQEVQKSLKEQGRPLLPLRPRDIIEELRREGKLVDDNTSKQVRLEGDRHRCFCLDTGTLLLDDGTNCDPQLRMKPAGAPAPWKLASVNGHVDQAAKGRGVTAGAGV
jgi:hypothetical protein